MKQKILSFLCALMMLLSFASSALAAAASIDSTVLDSKGFHKEKLLNGVVDMLNEYIGANDFSLEDKGDVHYVYYQGTTIAGVLSVNHTDGTSATTEGTQNHAAVIEIMSVGNKDQNNALSSMFVILSTALLAKTTGKTFDECVMQVSDGIEAMAANMNPQLAGNYSFEQDGLICAFNYAADSSNILLSFETTINDLL